jgi:hypothetical protein
MGGPLASTQKGTPSRHTPQARPFSIQLFTTVAFVLVVTTANLFLDLDFYAALKLTAVDQTANEAALFRKNVTLNVTQRSAAPFRKNATLNVTQRSFLGEGRPKVAWLMSFPNSGTTYTLKFVQSTTRTTTATNYGAHEQDSYNSISVYRDVPEGPFFRHPDRSVPETYLLTKTHCGGSCMGCPPGSYVLNEAQFEAYCRLGNRKLNGNLSKVTYPAHVVKAAIHLIRNPFDNIVARLHYEQNKWRKRGEERHQENLFNFTDDRQGFQRWCNHIDSVDINFRRPGHFSTGMLQALAKVPCYAEFGRFIQWHNNAIAVTRRLQLPTHNLFYENYTANLNATGDQLLSFLQLTRSGPAPVFIEKKHYPDYYAPGQIGRVATFARTIATPECWELVRHYFEDDGDNNEVDEDSTV